MVDVLMLGTVEHVMCGHFIVCNGDVSAYAED